jgi:NAD(P)-dependent dehydrogenase (short-subunit alcohol dehydrogenase family)/rhamnose utilization protein RhaD (predicted bifunctional aldolase and dehydrogenase)
MDQALADLIKISQAVGGDTALVQGGGGNTSVKTADGTHMYIKASGTAIKDLSESRGWRRLRVASVCTILDDESLAKLGETDREDEIARRLRLCCEDDVESGARPSVEAHLHAALDRCVVHLHPIAVEAYVCAKHGRAALEKLFAGRKLPPLWVPMADPGYMLALTVRRLVNRYAEQHGQRPSALFLEQHGLFVTAYSADEVLRRVKEVIKTCTDNLPKTATPKTRQPARADVVAASLAIRKAVQRAAGPYTCVKHYLDEQIAGLMARPDAKRLAAAAALTPDELVYANGSPLWLDRPDAPAVQAKLERLMARGEKPATSFLVKGLGLFIAGSQKALGSMKDVVTASLLVRAYAQSFGGPHPLSKRQRDFILNWESESFRKKIAGLAGEGDLDGRIAVVSGAGSGLGRHIAVGLAAAGAVVALADIDLSAARETAEMIAAQRPGASPMTARCDVTDEAAVQGLFDRILDEWGGIDILVNAAGIAPPFALVDLPVSKWRAALEINLTGYFLMAQAAARIMIQQGMGGNIINLSSKSGIEASRNNTAYNATKSGEIHMARGWAMELGQHGIRVNSVAPGNVFEGSKIWNPEYIRVCAQKYGIKPEQVIPHYVNMTSLKREIKGQDVADAIVFLCSDRARTITGQTLVCDGGQVMVR